MGLFRNRNTLKKRLANLEEELGYIYTHEDGYPEHIRREYGDVVRLREEVKELKEGKKK